MTKDVDFLVAPKEVGKLARQLFNTEHNLYASEHTETTAGQDILAARIARGDIEKDGLIFTKGGINK